MTRFSVPRWRSVLNGSEPSNFTPNFHLAQKMRDYTDNLVTARESIGAHLASIWSLDTSRLTFHAPVIDRLNPEGWVSEEVAGLKRFAEAVEHHASQLKVVSLPLTRIISRPYPQSFYRLTSIGTDGSFRCPTEGRSSTKRCRLNNDMETDLARSTTSSWDQGEYER